MVLRPNSVRRVQRNKIIRACNPLYPLPKKPPALLKHHLKNMLDPKPAPNIGNAEALKKMYADMLLELNRPQEALEQYRLSLKSDPNRFNGLYGAGRSAELANQKTLAGTYYKRLLDNCDLSTESDRPELQHAKRFVAETAIQ